MTEHGKNDLNGNESGVSPVIAIILMVAITIVLAGVLWLWVSDLINPAKDSVDPITARYEGRDENNDFVLAVTRADGDDGDMTVLALRYKLLDPDNRDLARTQSSVSGSYGKPIDDQTFLSFRDEDHDGKLSVGDRIIIKSRDHIDDDGTSSPGFAQPGDTLEIYSNGNVILEKKLGN